MKLSPCTNRSPQGLTCVLGPDHPCPLTVRHSLACAYASAERCDEAITLFEQVITDRARILRQPPPHSPHATRKRIRVPSATMKPSPCTSRLVARPKIRALGKDHPHTLTTLNNIAYTYRSVDRLPESITLYEQVIKTRSASWAKTTWARTMRRELADSYREAGHTDDYHPVRTARQQPASRVPTIRLPWPVCGGNWGRGAS